MFSNFGMFSNFVNNLSPSAEGFLVTWLILVVLILGIWASATNRAFMVNRMGKLSLGLGYMGTIYALIKTFMSMGSPNIDPALKGKMLAGGFGEALTYIALGLTVFAVLAL